MIMDLNSLYSNSIKRMKKSVIRELLKLTAQPDIISFAGGLPSPESFPVKELREVTAEVMEKEAEKVLQYGTTEGDMLLRERLVYHHYNTDEGLDITTDNLVIMTASQQALDLVGKIFVNEGDKIIVGSPTYLGGLSAFNSYGADMIGIPLDDDGMRADLLAEKLEELHKEGIRPKFIYVIPDFQNPTGITMSEKRRMEILELAHKYDILIIEDSPYRELRFEGEHQKMLYALDTDNRVIALGTFSKILCPSFRIGWVVANEEIITKFVTAKQAADLCTSPLTQRIAAKYLERDVMDQNLKGVIELYRKKRDLMLDAFDKYMPEGVTWVKPEGGLFLFLNVPAPLNTDELVVKAIEQKVAFVIGSAFYADGSGQDSMRINFSYVSETLIVEGVKRLANVIRKEMNLPSV